MTNTTHHLTALGVAGERIALKHHSTHGSSWIDVETDAGTVITISYHRLRRLEKLELAATMRECAEKIEAGVRGADDA